VVVPREPIQAGTPLTISIQFPAANKDARQVPRRISVETTADAKLAPLDAATVASLVAAIKT
jgi:hypothetical protein